MGLCYGIGISIAIIISFYIYEKYLSNKFETTWYGKYEYADDDEIKNLNIKEHKILTKDNKSVEIIGSLQNNSSYEWSNVKIEMEFYSAEGKFVNECTDRIAKIIAPLQKEEYFKVSCGSCNKEIPNFSKYTIKIVEGYGKRIKSTTSR